MYQLDYTNKFKKDYKLALKRGLNEAKIQKVISTIAEKRQLALKYRVHKMSGEYAHCWECHILPDWLLIWKSGKGKCRTKSLKI